MKRYSVVALALALALLAGCGGDGLPYAREMGDMALMRTLGVDVGQGRDQLAVTVSSGRRARGLQGEAQPPLILSAERSSLSAALLSMQGLSDSYVFYGHVDQLLLGETLVNRGAAETLKYFVQDPELGLGTQAWVIRGASAGDAISAGKEQGVDSRLTILQRDSEMGASGITRTVGETLTALLEDGAAYLPALSLSQDGALQETGYAVLKHGVLAGWLTGETARGLELAAGQTGSDILEFQLAGGTAVVRMSMVTTTCVPVFTGERLTGLELNCRLYLRLEESAGAPDREALCRLVEQRERQRVEQTLKQLQEWNADCLSLARRAGSAQASQWAAIRGQWEEAFPFLSIEVAVEAALSDH